jgi:hypothetical protein
VISYRATLDVPRELVQFTAKLLAAERRRRGTPAGSRALTCFWEAALALRWFRDRTSPGALARDHRISRATAYRYLDEVIEVLAAQAPDLHQALERGRYTGLSHVILDGKIIPCDRCKEPAVSVQGQVIDLWYSGKARLRSPVSLALRILSSHLARRLWRSSRSASCPLLASVAKQVNRWPSMSVNRSCAPGWGRSLRAMTRIPVGQFARSSRPVISATQAPGRTWPSASQAGSQIRSGRLRMAACTSSVMVNPTE